jgi:ribosomal protein L35
LGEDFGGAGERLKASPLIFFFGEIDVTPFGQKNVEIPSPKLLHSQAPNSPPPFPPSLSPSLSLTTPPPPLQVLHRRPGKQHLNGHKTTERKNRLSKERRIGKAQLPLIKGCLPYSKKYIR